MKDSHREVENINPAPYPVNPTRLLWPGLLLLYSLTKLWMTLGVELGKDEAAYWYWSQRLDATYALLPLAALRLFHSLLPYWEPGLRLTAVLSSSLAVFLLFRLCRLCGLSSSGSAWAAAAFSTSHWIWHTGSYLHPDSFLVACWLLSLCYARQSIGREDPALYAKTGVALGLTMLCKYSGAFLALALLVWIMLTRPRAVRWRLSLYCLLPALVVAAPLIHAQVRTRFFLPFTLDTLSQIAADTAPFYRAIQFLLNPLFFVSPLLLFLLYRAWGRALLDLRRTADQERLLVFLPALIPILAFGLFAILRGQIKGNWILPAFLSLWPLAFSHRILPSPAWVRGFLLLTVATGLLHALSAGLALKYPSLSARAERFPSLNGTYTRLVSAPDRQREPTCSWTERLCEYHGWQRMTARLADLLDKKGIPRDTPLAATQYGTPFGLAYYDRTARQYYTVDDPRFYYLADIHHLAGRNLPRRLLFVARSDSSLPASLEDRYPRRALVGEISRASPGCGPLFYQVSLLSTP